jgi:hypothetical protein
MSNSDNKPCRSLREIEAQVEAEMRAFGRRRLEEELQKETDLHGQIFPPQPAPPAAGAVPSANSGVFHRTQKPRVEWHEMKRGVFYRHEQRAQADNGRGVLDDKAVVSWEGDAVELGARLHWQAQALGLGRAQNILALADGAPWCWNLIQQRWPQAQPLLDFYHASQHLWEVSRALRGGKEEKARAWVEPRLHPMRHGKEKPLLQELSTMKKPRGPAGEVVRRNQQYFATHAGRMNYGKVAQRGWPMGSGAVESACRSRQTRFKRPGQFWTAPGLRHLCALEEARSNGHWNQLWNSH